MSILGMVGLTARLVTIKPKLHYIPNMSGGTVTTLAVITTLNHITKDKHRVTSTTSR
jgi:hypothetical protein